MSLVVDIKKRLGDFLLDVSFTAEDGIMGILGPSGCGKSMTLRCIAGVERPDEGTIVLDGETLFGKEDRMHCTVDCCHPNDLGFYRMAKAVYAKMKETGIF